MQQRGAPAAGCLHHKAQHPAQRYGPPLRAVVTATPALAEIATAGADTALAAGINGSLLLGIPYGERRAARPLAIARGGHQPWQDTPHSLLQA